MRRVRVERQHTGASIIVLRRHRNDHSQLLLHRSKIAPLSRVEKKDLLSTYSKILFRFNFLRLPYTLRVQSNAEIPRAHGQRIMCDLVGVGITEKGSWGIAVPKILERARETSPAGRCHHGVAACSDLGPSGVVWHFCVCPLTLC